MEPDGDGPQPVAISALEHWSYCPRQCGLIHLEATFDENYYTVKGRLAHERADQGAGSTEHGVRMLRDVVVWSTRLGLNGRVDMLEFHGDTPYPVELKSGQRRTWRHEAIQVCAQAMCLEEMLDRQIPLGAIAYLASHRRREIRLDAELRAAVETTTRQVRVMLEQQQLPPAVRDKRCRACSLSDSCLPGVVQDQRRLRVAAEALFALSEAEG